MLNLLTSLKPNYSTAQERSQSSLWRLEDANRDNFEETDIQSLHLLLFYHCGTATVTAPLRMLVS
ncbi:hypothetical protein [Chamaesiphon sp.]|uniref:hypothetical protein n=1 Tax=Chamaesiphon sp. TaxID=2814140 RepID=UPI0035934872